VTVQVEVEADNVAEANYYVQDLVKDNSEKRPVEIINAYAKRA
jgi:hypothetical protein